MIVREFDLIGKTEEEAIEYAKQHGYKLLIVERNGIRDMTLRKLDTKTIEVKLNNGKVSEVVKLPPSFL